MEELDMNIKETRIIMNACKQEFGYLPKTVAEFAAYINYLETKADEHSSVFNTTENEEGNINVASRW